MNNGAPLRQFYPGEFRLVGRQPGLMFASQHDVFRPPQVMTMNGINLGELEL
jgi:hypothetical protein